MIPSLTWFRRIETAGILIVVLGFSISPAWAGQIVSVPIPPSSGPGMGFVNIAIIVTPTPNNDDVPGAYRTTISLSHKSGLILLVLSTLNSRCRRP